MSTTETDDIVSQAPPAKRARLDSASDNDPAILISDMEQTPSTTGTIPAIGSAPQPQSENGSTIGQSASGFSRIPGLGLLGNAAKTGDGAEGTAMEGATAAQNAQPAPEIMDKESARPEEFTTKDSLPHVTEESMEIEVSEQPARSADVNIPNDSKEASLDERSVAIHSKQADTTDEGSNIQNGTNATGGVKDGESIHNASVPAASSRAAATEDTTMIDRAQSPLPLTHALESLLERHVATATVEQTTPGDEGEGEEAGGEGEHPEWEIDSSPYESSSDDTSSDDSSSEDSDEEGAAYTLLTPEEQARILMEGDGGSDDEGGSKGPKGAGAQLRTKNELPEEVIPKPDVTITPEMPIVELGNVAAVVEGTVLVKAKISGEYRVLESGSVLCLADRTVIGAVSETLGRVEQPLYCVRFASEAEIDETGLFVGTTIFYSERHSTYVFTQALKAFKGSDASNLHDEEVGDEEIEFSDDEAEMEHKRRLKQKRQEKRGGKSQQGGASGRGPHPLQQSHSASHEGGGLSYDDGEEDGPYRTLARPAGYAEAVGRGEAPQESPYPNRGEPSNRGGRNRDQFTGGRGRGRDRGSRGRGGDRGGRGHFQDRRGDGSGYSQPPQGGSYGQPPQLPTGNFMAQGPQGQGYSMPPQGMPVPPPNFFPSAQNQYSPQQPQLWQQYPPQPPFQQQQQQQQSYQQSYPNQQQGWPNMGPPVSLPAGAFINPAFFPGNQQGNAANQWNQQGQQGQQGGNR
ncbi:Gar1/Naf1 RNA binding region-domain-containing protein [Xylogone sp. PMI_703]|nr:Gar1/Naf1 RNA binding region-domain-containing protein [Xylogone sp. PMI_703]